MEKKTKVDLPSGNWAVFRDPSTLKVKDRKKIFQHSDNHKEGILQALSMVDGLLAILIEEWSYEMPIPAVKISMLDELSIPDYDKLSEEAGKVQQTLFPNVAKSEESEKDAESPFDKSNA